MKHSSEHPKAGQMVKIASGEFAGEDYRVEDWWDRVAGKSWMFCDGNPACLDYAMRSHNLPVDDEVVYGKIGPFGKLIHVSQLEG
jgi:hypothetical protein